MENVKVTIKEQFTLGFCFGMGLGLALIVYGLITVAAVRVFVLPGSTVRTRQVRYYQPTIRQPRRDVERVAARHDVYQPAAPTETHEQALKRIERERRELEAYLFEGQDLNIVDITGEANK